MIGYPTTGRWRWTPLVLIIPQWITIFARRDSPPAKTRLVLALVVGLTAALVVGTAVFWLLHSRS